MLRKASQFVPDEVGCPVLCETFEAQALSCLFRTFPFSLYSAYVVLFVCGIVKIIIKLFGIVNKLTAATCTVFSRGFRVGVVERGGLQGREQEWNISEAELEEMVEAEVLSKEVGWSGVFAVREQIMKSPQIDSDHAKSTRFPSWQGRGFSIDFLGNQQTGPKCDSFQTVKRPHSPRQDKRERRVPIDRYHNVFFFVFFATAGRTLGSECVDWHSFKLSYVDRLDHDYVFCCVSTPQDAEDCVSIRFNPLRAGFKRAEGDPDAVDTFCPDVLNTGVK